MSFNVRYIGEIEYGVVKSKPLLEDLTITPTREEQHFKSTDYYGYDNVTCEAINLQSKEVNPTTSEQVITADEGYTGLLNVQVNGVSHKIDQNIKAENIKDGITILEIQGTYKGEKYTPREITFEDYQGTELDYEINNLDTKNLTSMYNMFANCQHLTSLDVSHFDTSNVTSMLQTFMNCKALTSLDVSNFDTSKVTNMQNMFGACGNLNTPLDFSNWDTSKVTNFFIFLNGCSKLPSIDVSNFDTSSATDMRGMFAKTQAVTSLNLTNFDTSNVTKMNEMFLDNTHLETLDLSSFDTRKVTNMASILRSNIALREIKFGALWQTPSDSEQYAQYTSGTWTNSTTGVSYESLQALLEAGRTLGAIQGTWVKS